MDIETLLLIKRIISSNVISWTILKKDNWQQSFKKFPLRKLLRKKDTRRIFLLYILLNFMTLSISNFWWCALWWKSRFVSSLPMRNIGVGRSWLIFLLYNSSLATGFSTELTQTKKGATNSNGKSWFGLIYGCTTFCSNIWTVRL